MIAAVQRFIPVGLVLLGAVQLATGAVMLAGPGFFYDEVASFPPENEHFIRDIGTFTFALGAALLWSVRSPSWRLPVLAFAVLQYVLHSANHLADIDATETSSHGPANFVLIAIGTGFVGLLLYAEARRRGDATADP